MPPLNESFKSPKGIMDAMEKAGIKRKMKNPEDMSTDELIDLADEIKGDMASEWLKRRAKAAPAR